MLCVRTRSTLGYQLWKIEDRFASGLAVFQSNLPMHPDWWPARLAGEAYVAAGELETFVSPG